MGTIALNISHISIECRKTVEVEGTNHKECHDKESHCDCIRVLDNKITLMGKLVPSNLLNHFDTSQQVHSEINEGPINTFFLVFFLFKNEHVMVEKLLQFLIGKVNTKLLEAIELYIYFKLKDFCDEFNI